MKKQGTTRWMLRTNRKWIPALLLLLVCNVAMSLFGVWFALGTRRVVDAVTGSAPDKQAFISACVQQGILLTKKITLLFSLLMTMDQSQILLTKIFGSTNCALKSR